MKETATACVASHGKTSRDAIEALNEAPGSETTPYFLASMSHEIRTPMNSLLGMLELLEMTPLNPEQRDVLRVTRDSARTLVRVADDVLDLSKIQSGLIELESISVNLRQLIEDIVALLRAEHHGRSLQVDAKIDSGLASEVLTDPVRIRQILLNLACNAVKFTHRGSVILKVTVLDEGVVHQRIRIDVIDTGVGMSPEALEHVWQPFAQASPSTTRFYGGTGLGLTIAQQLATNLGGILTMSSVEGEGTTASLEIGFDVARRQARVAIPKTRRMAKSAVTGIDPHADVDTNSTDADGSDTLTAPCSDRAIYRVLLADDHPTNRLVMEMQLAQLGYTFEAVDNGLVALERLSMRRYDLLLTDCRMPELDGYGLTEAWRRIEAAGAMPMPVIGLTANPLPDDIPLREAAGMDDCLLKPIDLDTLDAMLKSWLPDPSAERLLLDPPPAMMTDLADEPVDLARLRASFGGEDMLAKVVKSFVESTQDDISFLSTFIECSTPTHRQCRARLHRITGGLQVLGDYHLADEGLGLEYFFASYSQEYESRSMKQGRTVEKTPEEIEYDKTLQVQMTDALRRYRIKVMSHVDWVARRHKSWVEDCLSKTVC